MAENNSDLYGEEYFQYLVKRSYLQKIIRKIYLYDIKKYCIGKTIDLGCGVGELLQVLPNGSMGFEVNFVAVNYCRSKGLNVMLFEPDKDDYSFQLIEKNSYESFTMNHVLEHLEDAYAVINKIFAACYKLGIKRLVFTVPGIKGFQSDKTHKVFIDLNFFRTNGLLNNDHYRLQKWKYFPFNHKSFSKIFVHNELRLVFDRVYD